MLHHTRPRTSRAPTIVVLIALLAALLFAASPAQADPPDDYAGAAFQLTILHNNDGESRLINAGVGREEYGGAARFKALVDTQRAAAANSLMISSGDNFLAGPEFNFGLVHRADTGEPMFDTIAMGLIGYDAVNLGNHDFDFGPDVLADFIVGYQTPPTLPAPYLGTWTVPPYVSANLDFSGEPSLAALVDPLGPITTAVDPTKPLAKSTVVTVGAESIGIIGLQTTSLASISSPRNVVIDSDIVNVVKAQVAALSAAPYNVDKIILTSHLQNIGLEMQLVSQVTGLDVVIAGGGDELLANPGDALIPGDEGDVFGTYPLWQQDNAGVYVPIVTTSGEYKYLGQLQVGFDADGDVVGIGPDSGPLMVSTAAGNDADMETYVIEPVVAGLADLKADVAATSEVPLDGRRDSIRFIETNQGNLIADSQLWLASNLADDFGVGMPDVALTNGGGIRNNNILPAGNVTVLDTFSMVPFPNFLAMIEDVPIAQFKEILENAVSQVDNPAGGTGRFAQIAGFSMMYNPQEQAQAVDGAGYVLTPGKRIQSVVLDDGTVLIENGEIVPGKATLNIASIDFLARGGDEYPFRGLPFTVLGATYQQALEQYLRHIGTVTAADYPVGGEGRIGVTLFESGLGLMDPNTGIWKLGNGAFYYGDPGDYPFVGDWNCDGVDTPGLYRQSDGFVYLRNSNTQGVADIRFFFGNPGDVPIAGDFDGDGCDSVSIYRPSNQTFYIIDELGANNGGLGAASFEFVFGDPGDEPFAADLDGDGMDEVALHRDTTGLVYYRTTLTTGPAEVSFIWGDPADLVFAGDWNGDGTETVGLLRPSDSMFYFRNTNTQGTADGSVLIAGGDRNLPLPGVFMK
jgi:5'-nucleotidase / UDP-sugar diphosphatase